jgi:hypothetical protein
LAVNGGLRRPVFTVAGRSVGSLDGAYDVKNMPLTDEPQRVQDDLSEIQESAAGSADPLDGS